MSDPRTFTPGSVYGPDTLVPAAAMFATIAHKGQFRRGQPANTVPYITHPRAVYELLLHHPCIVTPSETQAAAWLHDVVEDCGYTPAEIAALFGPRVGELVSLLTNPPAVSKSEKEKIVYARFEGRTDDVVYLKLADILHNLQTLPPEEKSFSENYRAGKRRLMPAFDAIRATQTRRLGCDLLRDIDNLLNS